MKNQMREENDLLTLHPKEFVRVADSVFLLIPERENGFFVVAGMVVIVARKGAIN